MNNKSKSTTTTQNHESNELLQYKLNATKKDNRKNLIISVLITSIFMFALGYITSYHMNCTQMNLVHENASLKAENAKLEVSQLKDQSQDNQ